MWAALLENLQIGIFGIVLGTLVVLYLSRGGSRWLIDKFPLPPVEPPETTEPDPRYRVPPAVSAVRPPQAQISLLEGVQRAAPPGDEGGSGPPPGPVAPPQPPPPNVPPPAGPRPSLAEFLWESLYHNKLLLLLLATVILIVYGQTLKSYGLPSLFWHQYPLTQAISGLAVVLFIHLIFYVIYIIDDQLKASWAKWTGKGDPLRDLWLYLGLMSLPFWTLVALPGVLPSFRPEVRAAGSIDFWGFRWPWGSWTQLGWLSWPWLVGMAGGLALVWGVASYRLFGRLHHAYLVSLGRINPTDRLADVTQFLRDRRPTAGYADPRNLLLIYLLLFALATLLKGLFRLGTPWGLFVVGAIVLGTAVLFRARWRRTLVVGACVLLVWWISARLLGRGLRVSDVFTAAFLICFALGLVAVFYAFLCVRNHKTQFFLLGFLAVAMVFNGWLSTKLIFPGLEPYYEPRWTRPWGLDRTFTAEAPRPLRGEWLDAGESGAPRDSGLLPNLATLEAWKASVGARKVVSKGQKPKLVVVTVSGGAIRSATWSMVVLATLERTLPGFAEQLRLITGASGGMLGTAYYTTTLATPEGRDMHRRLRALTITPTGGGDEGNREWDVIRFNPLVRDLSHGRDFLTPVVAQMVLHDLPSIICPFRQTWDRGRTLEEEWHSATDGSLRRTFHELRTLEQQGAIPSLVFSPILVEDGRRLIISNLDLREFTEDRGSLIDPESKGLYSRRAVQFFDLFPAANQFQVGTAVRMNATFPFVSPANSLPTDPPRRVMDAGLYDNYGVNLAAAWILRNAEWLADNTSGVALIQVRAFSNEQGLRDLDRSVVEAPRKEHPSLFDQVSQVFGTGAQFLTSPLDSLSAARPAINYFRNDEQVEVVSEWFRAHMHSNEFFTTVIFSCDEDEKAAAHRKDERYAAIANSSATMLVSSAHPSTELPGAEALERMATLINEEVEKDKSRAKQNLEETLSWTITPSERDYIVDGMGRNRNDVRLSELSRWWRDDHKSSDGQERRKQPIPWRGQAPQR